MKSINFMVIVLFVSVFGIFGGLFEGFFGMPASEAGKNVGAKARDYVDKKSMEVRVKEVLKKDRKKRNKKAKFNRSYWDEANWMK